ncbi:DUF2559 domain-containing protein [Pseudomonas sp. FSL R10-0056]|uniref:YhfG family protein n=1 Tax=unclassified Pseudomonas TaxID=196821 RepID=UPI00129535C2|nr:MULTISPECIES: YhfG family protein [unclassified Pseudomonas]MQT64295.1 DUF2559 domain-containing protein [Pseudomonas sp. FSL R10-0056]MQT69994.1 DUF2559 domain-containing protein [Pseudomonas sp. FSL R10-0071]MQU48719.1 DUF2559 domain-containing protein [Pseudomonas sp. FSL A6-1183]
MAVISLEANKAYAVKTRQSNYAASLRLEGAKGLLPPPSAKLSSHEDVLKSFTTTGA